MEKVPFDPGIGQFAPCFSMDVNYFMSLVMATKAPNQRKFKFQMIYTQILTSFEKIIGFYAGCLLWAYYIKNSDNGSEKEITDNNFFGQDFENNDDFDFLYEINFLVNYFEKFEKDVKFFLNKTIKLDDQWLFIAKTYQEFLTINNNFVATKTTNDLKLPKNFKPKASLPQIKLAFDKVLNYGHLEEFILTCKV